MKHSVHSVSRYTLILLSCAATYRCIITVCAYSILVPCIDNELKIDIEPIFNEKEAKKSGLFESRLNKGGLVFIRDHPLQRTLQKIDLPIDFSDITNIQFVQVVNDASS